MSVFAPTVNPNDTSDQTVKNITFFPDITVDAFRKAVRHQDTVTDERVIQALRSGIIGVNDELKDWRNEQTLLGYTTLAEIPADNYGFAPYLLSELTHYYLTAVYSLGKALLIERFHDVGATSDGEQRAEAFKESEDDYRREMRKAISKILGKPFTTVELI